jgi:large subunit ribosomal protein L6
MPSIDVVLYSNIIKLQICYINGFKLLLFTNKKSTIFYKELEYLACIKKSQSLKFTLKASWKFLNNFLDFYRDLVFKVRGFLILQGLGLKVQIIDNYLEFKLGYSHKCYLEIEKEINVKFKKNLLFLQSNDRVKLGNFLYRIKILRKPDVYKGKGIWYKNEKISFKPVKKTK